MVLRAVPGCNGTAKMSGTKHVIIVGASVAGLTLAHSLASANVEFTVLEARDDPLNVSSSGAGLIVLPNGARILDQLGLYEDLLCEAEPITSHSTWFEDGRLIRRIDTSLIRSRQTGYPLLVVSRRALLETLFNNLKHKQQVLFGRKVVGIDSSQDRITARCTDGSTISGDIIVGADGIYSTVRAQMWRHISQQTSLQTHNNHQLSRALVSPAYSGVFGTSSPVVGLDRGNVHRTYGDGWSMITTVGLDLQVFWLVVISRKNLGEIRRHKQDKYHITSILTPFLEKHVSSTVRFGDVFSKANFYAHVPLEESFESRWSWGRFACIGDAVHKMTPNLGQGANCAIETAASLANHIIAQSRSIPHESSPPPQTWDPAHQRTMKLGFLASKILVRVEAPTSWPSRLLGLYIAYFHGHGVIGIVSNVTRFSQRLNHLPLPMRTIQDGGRCAGGLWVHLRGNLKLFMPVLVVMIVKRLWK